MKANVCTYVSVPVPLIGTLWIDSAKFWGVLCSCSLLSGLTPARILHNQEQPSGVYVKKGNCPETERSSCFCFHITCTVCFVRSLSNWQVLRTVCLNVCALVNVHVMTGVISLTDASRGFLFSAGVGWQTTAHFLPEQSVNMRLCECVWVCSESTLGKKKKVWALF